MAEVICGVVKAIKDRETKFGTMYNVCVEDDQGELWLGWGKYPPKFGVGSEIEVEFSMNGDYANADAKTCQVINMVEPANNSRGGGRSAGNRNGGRSGSRGGNDNGGSRGGQRSSGSSAGSAPRSSAPADKPAVDWDKKDRIIQWQSCRNSAVALLQLAHAADALVLPTKKGEKYDALVALTDELTEKFFLDNETLPHDLAAGKSGKRGSVSAGGDGDDEAPFDDGDDDGLPE